MAWFKRSSRFTLVLATLGVAFTLQFVGNVPAQVQAQSKPASFSSQGFNQSKSSFRPPRDIKAPVNTQGGATRGPCVKEGALVALVPQSGGETVAESPTVYWYMPQISADNAAAPAVQFVLKDAKDQEVYSAKYPLMKSVNGVVGTPGVMSLTVSNLYPLEIGQDYQWELTLMCNSVDSDRSEDNVVQGGLKRVKPDPFIALRAQRATPEERVAIYADARLWYEALNTLVQLQRERPNDATLAVTWDKLLTSAGL